MDWVQVKISTTRDGIEPICALLYDIGITGVEISDKDDFKEFLENNRKYWDYVDEELEKLKTSDSCITIYVSADNTGFDQIADIKSKLQSLQLSDEQNLFGSLNVTLTNTKDEDWSENWKKYFKPLEVGEKILIVPEWENNIPKTNRIEFIINPGMSFGTGSHESTRMCIEEIEAGLENGDLVLDLGCGSGILSIIALLLGAKDATAVDIDPMAVETAYSNLKLNKLPKEVYHGFAGDVTSDERLLRTLKTKKYDVVLANIVADVIISLSPFVKEFIKDDGIFICSGIIIDRKEEVVEKLKAAGLKIKKVRETGEWAAVVCEK